MRKPVLNACPCRLLMLPLLFALPACTGHSVKLVHPRTGGMPWNRKACYPRAMAHVEF